MVKKMLLITLISLICLSITFVNAAENPNFDVGSFELDKTGKTVPTTVTNLTDQTMGTAISVARTVGIGAAITILMVIAVKYMLASPGDRADIKKNAVPFVIGAVVLFGASGILGLLAEFSSTISVK